MFKKLIRLIPNDTLVFLYKKFPITFVKDWIVRRAQHRFLLAVLGVITNENNEILLLNHTYREKPWGIPGGWLECEQPAEGLRREIKEEIGLDIKRLKIIKANYDTGPKRIELIFHGVYTGGEFKPSSEICEIQFCSLDNFPKDMPSRQKQLLKVLNDEQLLF